MLLIENREREREDNRLENVRNLAEVRICKGFRLVVTVGGDWAPAVYGRIVSTKLFPTDS